jgi:hypothetical protein
VSANESQTQPPARREFLHHLGAAGATLALGACTPAAAASAAASGVSPAVRTNALWDLAWVDRVRRASHRALFDGPQGDVSLMLAARYLDNVEEVYGLRAPDVLAVCNLRTRAARLALADALWQKYPIGEDGNAQDPATGAPARRNLSFAATPAMSEAEAGMTLQRLHQRGAIFLVCDFALGHLATRLAPKAGATKEAVLADLRAGLVPGAVLVPSGIFGMGVAQNAGCAFVPG